MLKNIKRKIIIPVTGLTILASSMFGQNIHGRVISALDLTPTPNIIVNVKTAYDEQNTITNSNGEYTINITGVKDETEISTNFEALSYPNPTSKSIIQYTLPQEENINIEVYDILGRKVKDLGHSLQQPGIYALTWDGTNNNELKVSNGIYFIRINAGKEFKTLKINYIKNAVEGTINSNKQITKTTTNKKLGKNTSLDAIISFTDPNNNYLTYIDSTATINNDSTNYDLEAYPNIPMDYPFYYVTHIFDFHKVMLGIYYVPNRLNDIPFYPCKVFLDSANCPPTWWGYVKAGVKEWNDSINTTIFETVNQPYTGDDHTTINFYYINNDTTPPLYNQDGTTEITDNIGGRPLKAKIYLNTSHWWTVDRYIQKLTTHELERAMYVGGECSERIEHVAYCPGSVSSISTDETRMGKISKNINTKRRLNNYKGED